MATEGKYVKERNSPPKTHPLTSPEKNRLAELRNPFEELGEDLGTYIMELSRQIKFFNKPVTYGVFFKENNLFKYEGFWLDKNEIILTGKSGVSVSLRVVKGNIYYLHDETLYDLKEKYLTYSSGKENKITNDIITSLKIKNYYSQKVILDANAQGTTGGRKASVKKEVCGKLRCIYKIPGSRKEHLKYKGQLIPVADFKKLMK